eukprot:scaffold43676_cov19-Tisochrysis_lutea.AAC.1
MNKMQMLNSTSQRFASNKALGLTPKALTPRSSLPGRQPWDFGRFVLLRGGLVCMKLSSVNSLVRSEAGAPEGGVVSCSFAHKRKLMLPRLQSAVDNLAKAIRGGSQSDLLVVCSFPPSSEQIWGGAQRGRAGVITPEHCTTDISVLALQLFSSKCAGTDSNACAVHVTAMCVGWMAAGADCEGAAPGEKYTGHGSPEPCYSRTCGWHHHETREPEEQVTCIQHHCHVAYQFPYWTLRCHWGCGQARGGQDAAGGEACACARARFPEGPGAAGEAACTWFLSISNVEVKGIAAHVAHKTSGQGTCVSHHASFQGARDSQHF